MANKYAGTKTEKNLLEAFAGESQARNKYTYFASVAKKAGYEQIAALFLKTAENEKEHAKLWFKALGGLGDTEENLKAAAEALFEELGMNLSTAFNIFVRQALRERGIPFMITEGTPNKETVSALLEAERIAKDSSIKGYHDVDELFADLDA